MLAAARVPHLPVLVDRVRTLLVDEGPAGSADEGVLVDATVGAGGHAAALLDASGPGVVLVGLDRDAAALDQAAGRLAPYGARAQLVHAPYDELRDVVTPVSAAHGPVLAVLYDLGVSSMQLDEAERGFSFRAEAPLDMRMDPSSGRSAADLVAELDARDLAHLLRIYGEERHARRIAEAIVAARPIATTTALAEVVAAAVPAAERHRATHPATRTFQALRIAVNDELDRFGASLPQALELATPGPGVTSPGGGRVAVLAYHSLEDRIAKRVFADATRGCVCPPELPMCVCGRVPRAVHVARGDTAGAEEVAANPRARSARLRVVELRGDDT